MASDVHPELCRCLDCFMEKQRARILNRLTRRMNHADRTRRERRQKALADIHAQMFRVTNGTCKPTLDYYDNRRPRREAE